MLSVGADKSEAHMVHASSFTASGTVKKVIEINPYLLGTMAGGAGESVESFVRSIATV